MRRQGIPIAKGRKIIKDNQPAHIDDYGREKLEALDYMIERLQETDPELQTAGLRQVRDYLNEIRERYRQ